MFGGDPVVFNKNYTYVVHILYWFEPTIVSSCTGSAIRHNVILSAAHCFVNSTQKEINTDNVLLTVLGALSNTTRTTARKVIVHRKFQILKSCDLSIIWSSTPLPVTPVKFPWESIDAGVLNQTVENSTEKNLKCLALGFGSQYRKRFQVLRKNRLSPILSKIQMKSKWTYMKKFCLRLASLMNNKTAGFVCVFNLGDQSPCVGDSGGPLVCEGVLRGVLSRGLILGAENVDSCGNFFNTMVYEDVEYHKDWIMKEMSIDRARMASSSSTILAPLLLIMVAACFNNPAPL